MIQNNYNYRRRNSLHTPVTNQEYSRIDGQKGHSTQQQPGSHKPRKKTRTYNYLSSEQVDETGQQVFPEQKCWQTTQHYNGGSRNAVLQRYKENIDHQRSENQNQSRHPHYRSLINKQYEVTPLQEVKYLQSFNRKLEPKNVERKELFGQTIKQIIENQAKLEKEIRMLKINERVAFRTEHCKDSTHCQQVKQEQKGVSNKQEDGKKSGLNPLTQYKSESVLKFLKKRQTPDLKPKIALEKQVPQKKHEQAIIQFSSMPENDRLIVSEKMKQKFWKQFAQIFAKNAAQSLEDCSVSHQNKKYELASIVNTNQLQKKLQAGLVAKVYSQCNQNVYK